MNRTILRYIEQCEGWKVAIKNLHWSSANLSQHKLCDDIADDLSEFEDLVAEVEQSISGKIRLNALSPIKYEITNLKSFVTDVIRDTKTFLNKLQGMSDNYIGIKAECEAFIGKMQRNLYLVDFTLKEGLRRRLKGMISESKPKNLANISDDSKIEKLKGRRPTTYEGRKNQIVKITSMFGVGRRTYSDESWAAIDEYRRAISLLDIVDDVDIFPCANLNKPDWDIQSDGGYCDYDETDHMPRSKQYKIIISYFDGMKIEGYIKCMAAGTVSNPFSRYDTCMVLWPKAARKLDESVITFVKEDIEIKKKNRNKFNDTKKRTGKTTEELAHSKNPLTRKRAVFALNAKKWNHSK